MRPQHLAQSATDSEAASHPRPLRLVAVLSLALALRTLTAALMFRNDPSTWFYDQASELTCLAQSILSGHGLSSPFCGSTGPSAFLAPGYPLLVAFVYGLFGASSLRAAAMITALQVLFGVATVLVTVLLANRLFGMRTAYIAGILCAISPTMVCLPTLFWETSVSTLFLTGILLFALRCVAWPQPAAWLAVGAYCAFAMLFNPALMVTFTGVGIWAACKTWNISRCAPLLAAGTCVVLFSIWPIRNAVSLHAFVPLRSNLGYELWQGNRRESQGFFTHDVYLNANRAEYDHYAAVGELPYMHEKQAIAVAEIKTHPLRFVRLSLKRLAVFWTALGGRSISWVVIGEITLTSFGSSVSLILLFRRRASSAFLLLIPFLVFPLPYYLTHPDFRFRLLLQPLALLLTASLLVTCYEYLKSFRSNAKAESAVAH